MSENKIHMKSEATLHLAKLSGLAYVKDSNGKSANLNFFTSCALNTADNTTTIKYAISLFKDFHPNVYISPDGYYQTFNNYQDAVDKYNELATKFKVVKVNSDE